MKGKNVAASAALVGTLLFGICVSRQPGRATSSWDKYGPAARSQHTAIYDAGSDTMVVFGGQHTDTSSDYNDLWLANNVTTTACLPPCALQWTNQPHKGTAPTARFGHTAVYDSVNLHMTVFGGAQGVATPAPCLNDVHILEFTTGIGATPTWVTVKPSGAAPPVRYSHVAVYDAADNEMIVFGGNNCGSTYYSDVWVLTNANGIGGTPAWSQLSPSGPAPAARAKASAVYDALNDNMIVFGGYGKSAYADLWVLTHAGGVSGSPAWVQLSPMGTAPSARYGHSAVYDSINNLMMIFGGDTQKEAEITETWVLTNANGLGGTPYWTLTSSNGPQRAFHSAVYNPASNKMIIFGGKSPKSSDGDPVDDHVFVLNNANGL
jgi:hypothetical protein